MRSKLRHFSLFIVIFGMFLVAAAPSEAQVVRGPYLQQGTSQNVTVRWRTESPSASVVRYGTSRDNLDQRAESDSQTTDHVVLLDGLQADTTYHYSVGDGQDLEVFHSDQAFRTAPPEGSPAPTQVWVLGDSGTANSNARAVRDAFWSASGGQAPDLWMMLGDNAYPDGTDAEYQRAVFEMYPSMLRRAPLWSTLGNHDARSADSSSMQGAYYDIFTLPTQAEAGGVASGTEAYYSFDYANIHFVCLDSHDSDRSADGAMAQWLRDDLAATTQQWIIAFWHHPPYTKGSHDSDREGRLIDMRENFLPILEDHGVDLVLGGHSHSYERSFLLDGHYGHSDTFDASHQVDNGDGRPEGDGAYRKNEGPNGGAVYAVAGSSGKISGGSLDHPAMFISLNELGSMILDVHGHRLEARFLNDAGEVTDSFTIEKGDDELAPTLRSVSALGTTEIELLFDEPLDSASASLAANYSINGGIEVRSAELRADQQSVLLTTSSLDRNVLYTLSVSQVADQNQNAIDPAQAAEFALTEVEWMSFRDGQAPTANYDGTADTKIKADAPDTNFGQDEQLEIDGDPDYGVLLRWDVSALPTDVTVVSAEVVLEVYDTSGDRYPLFEVLRDWNEGQATWRAPLDGEFWGAPGAAGVDDHASEALATLNGTSAGSTTVELQPAAFELIEGWAANPQDNFGLIVDGYNSATNGVDFYSRETSQIEHRPMLRVQFHPELRRAQDNTGGEDAGHAGGDAADDDVGAADSSDGSGGDADATSAGDAPADATVSDSHVNGEGSCACTSVETPRQVGLSFALLTSFLLLGSALFRRRLR